MTAGGSSPDDAGQNSSKPFDTLPPDMLWMVNQPTKARAMQGQSVVQLTPHQQRLVALMFDRVELVAELLDLLFTGAIGLLDIARVFPLPFGARDLVP